MPPADQVFRNYNGQTILKATTLLSDMQQVRVITEGDEKVNAQQVHL